MDNSILVKLMVEKIQSKKAKVGIVGMGYVGVPLAFRIIDAGYSVIGYDVDVEKATMLNKGKSCFSHIASKTIAKYIRTGKLEVHTSADNLTYCDVILICVPTPINENQEPDLSCVESACQDIAQVLRKGHVVILESSTYPGTTENLVLNILKENVNDYEVGVDYFLGYSPEREDPGNPNFSVKNTPKIVAGLEPNSKILVESFYRQIVDTVVPVSSTTAAEMVKILENTYRAVNIALVNELKVVCTRMGLNIWEVINAAKTKPFGYQAFYPSVGVGGHCISVDPLYLAWQARRVETPTKFIELANEINWEMPRYVVQRIQRALNIKNKAVKGSRILILGVAYKKNVNDIRESSALKVMRELLILEGDVSYSDPLIPELILKINKENTLELLHTNISTDVLQSQDCVVLLTDHDCFDYSVIFEHAQLIVDTRNQFNSSSSKVVQA